VDKWILVAKCNCADLVDGYEFQDTDAFNDWYDNVHIPDVMKAPGVLSARRFIDPDNSTMETGKYLCIYEIETDDIGKTMGAVFGNLKEARKQGRISKLLDLKSTRVYKQIGSQTKK
jgi:hypothetical protein